MLIHKVKETIKKYGMLNPGDLVLTAVSGGPDSVCLLSVLYELREELGISLHVAHLDHMFRGRQSADEALFVARLAGDLGLPASVEKIDVPAFCADRGVSAQAGAREARYEYLSKTAEAIKARRIATGHTADDQAETLLMRLIRGAGVSGLSAIPPKRGEIIRPLIETTREEIMEYLGQRGLEYCTDPSNEKPLYTRNRIRREILPVLRTFNPRIVETLAAEADLLRNENEAVEEFLAPLSEGMITKDETGVSFPRETFNALPRAYRRRMLKKAVDMTGIDPTGFSVVQVDEALRFMASAQTGRTMQMPFGLRIEREYEKLFVRVHEAAAGFSYVLALPGVTPIPELNLEIETLVQDLSVGAVDENKINFWQALFDYAKINNPLILRTRRPGDRFCPSGMSGRSKKLQDYLVDRKIPRPKRDTVPLLVSGQDIVWAVGLRTDERFLPVPETKRMLIVRVFNSEGDR